jgi:hypothetical protein
MLQRATNSSHCRFPQQLLFFCVVLHVG